MRVWSSRSALPASRRETWRHGSPEARHRRGDVKVWRYGVLGTYCSRVDVEAWSYGGLDVWRSGGAL